MMTQLPGRATAAKIAAETVVVIAAEIAAETVVKTVVKTVAEIAAETVVVMAKTTAQKVTVQKTPKAGVVRTPILIPALVAKPMKVG